MRLELNIIYYQIVYVVINNVMLTSNFSNYNVILFFN